MAAKVLAKTSIYGSVHSVSKIKKLINEVPTTVDDALLGLVMANRGLVLLENQRIVIRRDHAEMVGKVKLISGGGSGNEPAHASFVGPGMLTAAVIGDVFTAPPSSTILCAIRELAKNHPDGILLIVKNYTGDRLNFGVAMERARNEGINIKMIVVGEDCSMPVTEKLQGRRGLAGTILIHKLAGGMAEEGKTLEDIFSSCRSASMSDMATISVGLKLTNFLRGMSKGSLVLGENELELGLGINGEPGVHKISMGTAAEIVHSMLEHMLNPNSRTRIELDPAYPIIVLINNMGGSSKLEEQVFTMEALKQITNEGYKISRVYCGTFLTSLETAGFSITILKVKTPEILKYLDAPTSAPGWPRTLCAACVSTQDKVLQDTGLPLCIPSSSVREDEEAGRVLTLNAGPKITDKSAVSLLQVLNFATDALSACEFQLNQFDAEAGDGDTGTTLKRGAEAIKRASKSGKLITNRPYVMLETISTILESTMGGTAGALYSIFFAAAAKAFQKKNENDPVNAQTWLEALREGIAAVMRYGRAEIGDRTMLDSLSSAAFALEAALTLNPDDQLEALGKAAAAAEDEAKETIGKKALIGKASDSTNLPLLMPDPGAHAVGIWMRAVYEGCRLLF
ncbi:triokinase/FMN cyclase isoform X1 [Periplaneta americana]|uniref:triokinase/FMN cyclase isoform X1 n=1 Tax=Periplaneta americana TaxID=6978 RepID=UPI0037E81064